MPPAKKAPVKKEEVQKGPIYGGLMKRTLKELQSLDIQLKDLFSFTNSVITLNLTWEQVIKLCNFNAGEKVLHWDHTFEEAFEIIKIFLM